VSLSPRIRYALIAVLPWFTGAGVLVELLSLRLGLLNHFFFDAMHADVQAIDFYSLPVAFLNLHAGRSMYDTFGPASAGYHLTWYLAHPALAVVLGSWLSLFDLSTAYGIFTMLSLVLMGACAWFMARMSADPLVRRFIWFLVMTAFPTYCMLFVGNVQALLVLALGMLFTGVFALAFREKGENLVLAGLLLSLLTKPAVLLMLPLLLLMEQTRRAAIRALVVYIAVSVLFEVVPVLNPEAIGLNQVFWLAVHPQVVRSTMNIYANHMQVNAWMKDNSIHWFNLVAQSGMRLMHIDVYSLPVFLDTLLGFETPSWLYDLLLVALFALQVLVARIQDTPRRLQMALLLLMASSLAFFLAYPTVWEYQYTGVLPVAAMLLLARERKAFFASAVRWMFPLAACVWLPTLFFLIDGKPITGAMLTLIRLDRVLPVTVLFTGMIILIVRELRSAHRAARSAVALAQ
jgi:hypothetical protein